MAWQPRACGLDARSVGKADDRADGPGLSSTMRRVVAFLFVLLSLAGLATAPRAQTSEYATLATISATMGVNGDRLCLGESSRGDIGCPTHAPFVDSAGRVGIGTSSPAFPLDVNGNGRFTAAGAPAVVVSSTLTGGKRYELYLDGGSAGSFGIFDRTSSTWPFFISAAGNVALGSAAPTARLQIVGGEVQTATSGASRLATTSSPKTSSLL